MSIKCNKCGYERPSNIKQIGTECPVCEEPYPENVQLKKEEMNLKLTKCKDCNKEVSKAASKCPHCGVSNPGITNKEIGQGCLAVIVLAFIFSIALSMCSSQENSLAECDNLISAFVMSQTFVKKKLKSPTTAKFPSYSDEGVKVVYEGECKHKVLAYVDSQNSFGAMLRANYYAEVKNEKGTDTWVLLELHIE